MTIHLGGGASPTPEPNSINRDWEIGIGYFEIFVLFGPFKRFKKQCYIESMFQIKTVKGESNQNSKSESEL